MRTFPLWESAGRLWFSRIFEVWHTRPTCVKTCGIHFFWIAFLFGFSAGFPRESSGACGLSAGWSAKFYADDNRRDSFRDTGFLWKSNLFWRKFHHSGSQNNTYR